MYLKEDQRSFYKRVRLFVFMQIFVLLIIVSRLYYLQVVRAGHYKMLSDKNRIVTQNIAPARRGNILDVNGSIIAGNEDVYHIYVDLTNVPKQERRDFLSNIVATYKIPLSDKEYNDENYYTIIERAKWHDLIRYICIANVIPEICVTKNTIRYYKYGPAFAHVIGYIGRNGEDTRCGLLPNAKVGINGLEKIYDSCLFGTIGVRTFEVNALRQFVRDIEVTNAIDGQDIDITINKDLQIEAYKLISKYKSAACVVLDVDTGAVLCYISCPSYDTNIYCQPNNKNLIAALYKDALVPMYDKVANGLYSPGSTFKMIIALAALKNNIVDFDTKFHCCGHVTVGNARFNCWNRYGHGYMNLCDAITRSCNSYFYNLGQILTVKQIYETAYDFGLCHLTNIDLNGEKIGLVGYQKWPNKADNVKLHKGDVVNMAIGQGYVLCTPLQMACMVATIANGEYCVKPYLNKSLREYTLSQRAKLQYKKEHLDYIKQAMMYVINRASGTAYGIKHDADFLIAGKTGTAQVCKKKYDQDKEIPYELRDHALFVGFAPFDSPKYAICVVVEHGGGGGKVAAPLARDILLLCRKYLDS